MDEVDFVELGSPADPLGPGDRPQPHLRGGPARRGRRLRRLGLARLAPADTMSAAGQREGLLQLVPARVTLPERIGDVDLTGATVVFEVVVDDYAEVWVNGELPHALGDTGGPVVGGFNAPNRVVITRDARPGRAFHDRGLRDQRPDLGGPGQLHLDAHRDARRVRARARRLDARRSSRASWNAWQAASSSRKGRSGRRRTERCCSARPTRTRSIGSIPSWARSLSFARRAATPAWTSAATSSPARTG